jgi:hypothetical protein
LLVGLLASLLVSALAGAALGLAGTFGCCSGPGPRLSYWATLAF